MRNRVGQAVSGYVFLLNLPAGAFLTAGQQVRKLVSHQSVLPFSPRKPGGEGCGHISLVPTTYLVEKCVWKAMPVALLWFGLIFLSDELGLKEGVGRESEETYEQRFRS